MILYRFLIIEPIKVCIRFVFNLTFGSFLKAVAFENLMWVLIYWVFFVLTVTDALKLNLLLDTTQTDPTAHLIIRETSSTTKHCSQWLNPTLSSLIARLPGSFGLFHFCCIPNLLRLLPRRSLNLLIYLTLISRKSNLIRFNFIHLWSYYLPIMSNRFTQIRFTKPITWINFNCSTKNRIDFNSFDESLSMFTNSVDGFLHKI